MGSIKRTEDGKRRCRLLWQRKVLKNAANAAIYLYFFLFVVLYNTYLYAIEFSMVNHEFRGKVGK